MPTFEDAECKTCKGGITKDSKGKWQHDGGSKDHAATPRYGSVVKTTIK